MCQKVEKACENTPSELMLKTFGVISKTWKVGENFVDATKC